MSKKKTRFAGQVSSNHEPRPAERRPPSVSKVVRINRRLVLFTGVGVLLFGAGIHGLHAVMVDHNAGDVLTRADRAAEQGDKKQAARLLSQYMQFRPDDLDVLERHALLLHDPENPPAVARRVAAELEKILRDDPSRVQLRQPLSEAAVSLRRYEDAEFQLDELLRVHQDDAELVKRKAAVRAARSGRSTTREGAELYLAAIALDPQSVPAYAELAALLQSDADALPYWDPVAKRFLNPGMGGSSRPDDEELSAGHWVTRADAGLLKLFPPAREMTTAPTAATGILDRMVADAEPAWKAYAARAANREAQGDLPGAAEDIRQALASPEAARDSDLLMLAATVELAQAAVTRDDAKVSETHRAAAMKAAQAGIVSETGDPRLFGVLADAELARGITSESLAAAEKHLRDGLKRIARRREGADAADSSRLSESEIWLRVSLANLMILRGENDGSRSGAKAEAVVIAVHEEVQRLRDVGCRPELIELIEIRLLGLRHDWNQAARRLESLRPQVLDARELVRQVDEMLGVCYVHLRNPDRRIEVFQRAVADDPAWAEGRILLAAALAESGRTDEAIAEYRTVSGNAGVPRELARLALRVELRKPEAERDFTAVESLVAAAERASPDEPETLALRLELLAARGNYEAVEDLAHQRFSDSPESPAAWLTTFQVAMNRTDHSAEQRLAAAHERLTEGEQRFGDAVEVRLARVELERSEHPDQFRTAVTDAVADSDALPAAERVRLYEGLIASASRAGDGETALSLWKRIVEVQPDHLAGWLAIVQGATEAGDVRAADDAMRAVRRIEGSDGPNGDYLEAIRRIGALTRQSNAKDTPARQNEIDEVRQLLARAAQRRPYWAAVPRASGILETLAGDSDAAFEQFRHARDLGDLSPQVIRGLIAHHAAKNRWDLAAAVVDDVEQDSPELFRQGELARLKGVVSLKQGDLDGAIAAIARSRDAESFDSRLTQASLLSMKYRKLSPDEQKSDAGRKVLEEATGLFQRLVTDAPQESRAWLAYIAHLVRVDQRAEANRVVADAESRIPADPAANRLRCLAQCYQAIQEPAKAAERMQQAIAAAPDDAGLRLDAASLFLATGDRDAATRQLEWLLDNGRELSAELSSRARRLRAIATAATGRYEDHRRAVASLNSSAADETPIADLRAQVTILATRSSLTDRRELIRLMEMLRDRALQSPESTFSPGETFALASLYQQTNQWAKARPLIEALQAERGVDVNYTTALIMGSLRDRLPTVNDADLEADLAVHLDRLKELETGTMRIALTVAEFEARFGRRDSAARVLSDYVGTLTTGDSRGGREVTPQELAEIRAIAGRAEELKLDRVAEACFRSVADHSSNPNDSLLPAMYLGRQGRYDEALKLVEARPAGTSAEAAALAAVSIVSSGRPTPEEMTRAEAIANVAMQETPGSSRTLGLVAGLRMAQGRYEESEAIYRRILAENPADVSVLNNLAWLLVATGRDPEAAGKLIDEAIAIAGPIADLIDTRGVVLLTLHRPEDAVAVLQDEFENGPSPKAALGFHLASAYLAIGRPAEARTTFASAKQLGLSLNGLHATEHQAYEELARRLGEEVR